MTRLNSGLNKTQALGATKGAADRSQRDGVSAAEYSLLPTVSRFGDNALGYPSTATTGAVFLDRDGVIVENVHYLKAPSQLKVLPGVFEAICQLQDKFYVMVVTNQSGIARGLFNEDALLNIHTELARQLSSQGAILDCISYCPHLEGATITKYNLRCDCRKPEPGMLLRAAKEWGIDLTQSFLVGDQWSDVTAGQRAGVTPIIVGDNRAAESPGVDSAADLLQAASFILAAATDPH